MVSRKSHTGLFSSRTTGGIFGDTGQSDSIFGKARVKGEYTGDKGKSPRRKARVSPNIAGKPSKGKQRKNRPNRRRSN